MEITFCFQEFCVNRLCVNKLLSFHIALSGSSLMISEDNYKVLFPGLDLYFFWYYSLLRLVTLNIIPIPARYYCLPAHMKYNKCSFDSGQKVPASWAAASETLPAHNNKKLTATSDGILWLFPFDIIWEGFHWDKDIKCHNVTLYPPIKWWQYCYTLSVISHITSLLVFSNM